MSARFTGRSKAESEARQPTWNRQSIVLTNAIAANLTAVPRTKIRSDFACLVRSPLSGHFRVLLPPARSLCFPARQDSSYYYAAAGVANRANVSW